MDFTPYQYAANNPILFIDVNGDSINVAEKYRKQFNSTLQSTFGENAKNFSYTESGNLIYSGSEEDFKGKAKKVFNGMSAVMNEGTTTNVVYGASTKITLNDGSKVTIYTKEGSGAVSVLVGEENVSENTILINPNIKSESTVKAVTEQYYVDPPDPKGGDRFKDVKIKTNVADATMHELGHVIYRGQTQDKVINFNNAARGLMKMKKRPYDETHNIKVKKGAY